MQAEESVYTLVDKFVITYNYCAKHLTECLYQAFIAIDREQIKFSSNGDSFHVDLHEQVALLMVCFRC